MCVTTLPSCVQGNIEHALRTHEKSVIHLYVLCIFLIMCLCSCMCDFLDFVCITGKTRSNCCCALELSNKHQWLKKLFVLDGFLALAYHCCHHAPICYDFKGNQLIVTGPFVFVDFILFNLCLHCYLHLISFLFALVSLMYCESMIWSKFAISAAFHISISCSSTWWWWLLLLL